jgi:hypothetical protein
MISYFPVVTGSLTVEGSVNISGGITASGGITISGSIASASFASTASFVALAQSASNAVSAQTASFANTLTVAGNLTAQTLVVQTITSSVDFVTGSTRFGSILDNTHVFSGSVSMNPGGLFVSGSGLVGIGTTSPVARLNVFGTSGNPSMTADTNNLFSITGNLGPQLNIGGYNGASYGMWLQVKDANNTNINYPILLQPLGGAVGIGTASPGDTLFISRNAADNSGGLTLYNANTSGYGSALTFRVNYAGVYNTSRIHGDWDTGNAGALHFYTANTSQTLVERMLITGGGNIGIGVTPSAWASPFTVIQGGSHGQHIGFQSNGPDMKIGSNNYYNGSNYIYTVSSNGAAQLNIGGNSGFSFSTAPSGTAGNAVTFTTALYIPVGGSVYINNATTSNFINLESLLGNAGSAIISIAQTDSNKLAKATIIVQRSAYLSGVTYTVATLATQPIANYLTFGISGTYLTINTTGGAGTMAYNALVIPAY